MRYMWIGRGVLSLKLEGETRPKLYGADEPLPEKTPPDVIKAGLAKGTIAEWPDDPVDAPELGENPELEAAQQAVDDAEKVLAKQQSRLDKADTATKIKNAEKAVTDAAKALEAAMAELEELEKEGDD
jgi:hypothetical protein